MKNLVQTNSKTFPFELILKGKTKSSKGKFSNINFVDLLAANGLMQNKNKKTSVIPSLGSIEKKINKNVINNNSPKDLLTRQVQTKNNDFQILPIETKKFKSIEYDNVTKINSTGNKKLPKTNNQIRLNINTDNTNVTKQKSSSIIQNTVKTKSESLKNITKSSDTQNLFLTKTKLSKPENLSTKNTIKPELLDKNIKHEFPVNNVNNNLKTVSKINSKDYGASLESNKSGHTKQVSINKNNLNQVKINNSFDSTLLTKNNGVSERKAFTPNTTNSSLKNNTEVQNTNSNIKNKNVFSSQVKDEKPDMLAAEKTSDSRIMNNKESFKINSSEFKNEVSPEIKNRNEKTNLVSFDSKDNQNPQKSALQPSLVSSDTIQKSDKKDKNQKTLSQSPKVLINKEGGKNEGLEYVKTKIASSKTKNENSSGRNSGNQISEKINQTPIKDHEENIELKNSQKTFKSDNKVIQNTQLNAKPIQIENLNTLNPRNIDTSSGSLFTSSANSVMNTFLSNTQSIANQIIQSLEVAKPQISNVSKFEIDLGQNEKFEIQFTKQGENHSARIFVGSESTLLSIEKLIPELKIQLENKGINFISLDVEMENFTNENQKNENKGMASRNQNNSTKINNSKNQIIDQISAIRDFGYNTIEILA